ncbi:MAG: glyoxalase, partial [Sciscionella sp.]|nr:glyoxalase [Sciscionella sp.]
MLDPLDALYLPVDSVTPDQEFAADLRDRLRRKVFDTMHDNSTGEEMSDTQTTNALTPYLAVRDAMAAIRWYTEVFDATLRGEPIQWHGRIGHAELTVFGARLMLS